MMKPIQIRNAFAYAVESMYLTHGGLYASDDKKNLLREWAYVLRGGGRIAVAAGKVDGVLIWPIVCDTFAMFFNQVVRPGSDVEDLNEGYADAFNAVFCPTEDCEHWLDD